MLKGEAKPRKSLGFILKNLAEWRVTSKALLNIPYKRQHSSPSCVGLWLKIISIGWAKDQMARGRVVAMGWLSSALTKRRSGFSTPHWSAVGWFNLPHFSRRQRVLCCSYWDRLWRRLWRIVFENIQWRRKNFQKKSKRCRHWGPAQGSKWLKGLGSGFLYNAICATAMIVTFLCQELNLGKKTQKTL